MFLLLIHEGTPDGSRRTAGAFRTAGVRVSIVNAGAPPGAAAS